MSEPARAPEHDAPPPWRPLSAGAVTALVLALLLAPFAIGGAWWLEVLPLVIGAGSWWAIADGRRRGRGVAGVACALAAAVGVLSLLFLGAARDRIETQLDAFLRALAADNRPELEHWVLEGEDRAATVARWRARMEAVEREAGPYGRRVDVDWGLWGPFVALIVPPSEPLAEIGAPPGGKRPGPGSFWFRAAFARERVWAALEVGREDAPLEVEQATRTSSGDRIPFLRSVRFFRESAGTGGGAPAPGGG